LIDGCAGGSERTIGRMLHASTYLHASKRNASENLHPLLGWHRQRAGASECRRIGVSAYSNWQCQASGFS
jgi:hypothetical protein